MENIKKGVHDMLGIMEQEIGLVDDLLAFAQEKTQLLARADVEGLNKVLTQEEDAVIALREKEKERKTRAKVLAEALCVYEENPTLKKLTERIEDPEWSRLLSSAGNEIFIRMQKLSRQNKKVKGLLEHQVGYTDYMLNLLYSSQNKTHFYNIEGNREEQNGYISRLDYHA